MEKMNSSNTSVSMNPKALPVVFASNVTYEPVKRGSSDYVVSVVEEAPDQEPGSPEE